MNRNRLMVLAVCIVGVLVAGALIVESGVFRSAPKPAAVGGPFELVDYDGKPTDESVLKGKWSAMFFGFTYCPDVCPGTLQALATASDQLGPRAKDLQIVMISVDPARDTPAQMKTYLTAGHLPKNIVGLTGTQEQVDATVKAYRAYAKKVGDGPDYTVDHSTMIYVIDPKGRFHSVIGYGSPPDEIARQLKAAMKGA
ncbi:photosynthetic protein synthase I [Caulobacter vibrioides]|nr:photosynthetic protein synthase I [Caulobacter vibrioides]